LIRALRGFALAQRLFGAVQLRLLALKSSYGYGGIASMPLQIQDHLQGQPLISEKWWR
jgi:hypothetical protein